MNRFYGLVMGALAFGLVAGTASAQGISLVSEQESIEAPKTDALAYGECCDGSYWLGELDFTFFRYHRADGVDESTSGTQNLEFGFDFAPRFTIGYVNNDGLGTRLRYWDYDESHSGGGDTLAVDTYVLDIEMFKEIELTCDTSLEWSVGFRYNEYNESGDLPGTPTGSQGFNGPGLVAGLQVNQKVWFDAVLYARARGAVVMGDKFIDFGPTNDMFDTTRTIIELASGVEWSRCLNNGAILSVRAGVELQNWANYTFAVVNGPLAPTATPTDVGFGGFVLGAGLEY